MDISEKQIVDLIKSNFEETDSRSEKRIVLSSNANLFFFNNEKLIKYDTLFGNVATLKLTDQDKKLLELLYYKLKLDVDELHYYVTRFTSEKLKQRIYLMTNLYYDIIKRNFVVRDMFFTISKEGEILLNAKVIL